MCNACNYLTQSRKPLGDNTHYFTLKNDNSRESSPYHHKPCYQIEKKHLK